MKTTMKKILAALLASAMLLSFAACSSEAEKAPAETPAAPVETPAAPAAPAETPAAPEVKDEDVDGELILDHEAELEYAHNFSLKYYKGGYKTFTVSSDEEHEFLIVPEGKSVPADLAANMVVLQQPINKMTFNSTGMVSIMDAIDALDNIATVGTDADGWYIPNVKSAVESGDILYSGSYKEPDYELLMSNGVQIVIDTTMLNNNPDVIEKYNELNIPIIVEQSSKESHPLGRVEWVKLLAALAGKDEAAETYFAEQVAKVKAVSDSEPSGKTVAMFFMSSDGATVYARNAGDYMTAMIEAAGGDYIMADVGTDKTGNAKMNMEDFYAACGQADYIFYLSYSDLFATKEEMIAFDPIFADFKAVQDGNVWLSSDTFTQSTAAIATIIENMNTVLNDNTVAETETLIKLGE